jgi:hypothetical protein
MEIIHNKEKRSFILPLENGMLQMECVLYAGAQQMGW